MKRIFGVVLVMCLGLGFAARAQEGLVDRSFTGVSKDKIPQAARKDILDQAYQQISEDLIKDLIGEERFSKNKSLIKSKIIDKAPRYVPFSKPGEMSAEGEGFKMSVAVKISLRDLKMLLQENGLLNESESTPVVMPVVSLIDRVNMKSYRWWQAGDRQGTDFLQKEGRTLENALRSSFERGGFYALKPQQSGSLLDVPLSFQNEKLNAEDMQFFGSYFNASVLIDGQVIITRSPQRDESYRIEVRMSAVQVSNLRPIADVSRKFDTPAGSFEAVVDKRLREVADSSANDLTTQVLEAWQRGSLGTSMVKLTVSGQQNLNFLESFKEKLKNQVPQVRNIRERLFSPGHYTFEVDTSADLKELAQKLQGLDVDGKKISRVSQEGDNEILIQFN